MRESRRGFKAMQEQDGKKFNISERLEDLRREHEALRWEGSFRDYFELVAKTPVSPNFHMPA